MEKKNQNKYEYFASHLHGEETQEISENTINDKDFKAIEVIFAQKEKVRLLDKISPLDEIKSKIDSRIRKQIPLWKRHSSLFKYAAVLTILMILSGTLIKLAYYPSSSEDEKIICISSSSGEIKKIILNDSTKVWLGSNSSLEYSNRYGHGTRQVKFTGEAMFDVSKDVTHPFLVMLNTASSIKVVGTRFIVSSYTASSENQIVLLEGKVNYKANKQTVPITPGKLLAENKETGKIIVNDVDINDYTEWENGKIHLDSRNLKELTFMLEQWYNVHFIFEKEDLKNYYFTGTIDKTKPIDYTLQLIELTNKVKFKKDKNGIIITK